MYRAVVVYIIEYFEFALGTPVEEETLHAGRTRPAVLRVPHTARQNGMASGSEPVQPGPPRTLDDASVLLPRHGALDLRQARAPLQFGQ